VPSDESSKFRAPRALIAVALLAIACGGGKQAEPAADARDAAGPAVPPPPPTEPLRLLPDGVKELVTANLKQLRGSPHYALAGRWIRRYACLDAEPSHFLMERTERLVLAAYTEAENRSAARSLAVLRGEYRTGDAGRALAQAGSLLGTAAAGPVSEQTRGRFRVLGAGALSAALVGERMMVIGDTERVMAALDIADGKRAAWIPRDALMQGVDTERWVADHTAAVIMRVDARTAQRLGRELSVIGGRRLGENLNQSSAALALLVGGDLTAQAQVLYTDARIATEAADGLRAVMARADLVLRLTGLPSAVERTRVSADGERLNVTLTLSSADIERVGNRLEPLLGGSTPACGTQAARPPAAPEDRAAL
jgi:hypothetical protein